MLKKIWPVISIESYFGSVGGSESSLWSESSLVAPRLRAAQTECFRLITRHEVELPSPVPVIPG